MHNMAIQKKIIKTSLTSNNTNKPDTVVRAGITANLKFTRGKQLVEHDPFLLIPDPDNPRPGEIINENWLKHHLFLRTDNSLCTLSKGNGEYIIPTYSQLKLEANEDLEESYNFLRELALSIRIDGLIEPIEIFLADRQNDPAYFNDLELDYGYVILEGHQRRLAAMMAGVPTVTCIEITDESMLVKLKVKHRKLRRQLSENNLRKNLTVAQNFQIIKELLNDISSHTLTNKELASIIGLNESIISSLRSICINAHKYPPVFFSLIQSNKLTFKKIRMLSPKNYHEIENLLNDDKMPQKDLNEKKSKVRGKQGGAVKKSVTFKVRDLNESLFLQQLLLSRFPEIQYYPIEENVFVNLEKILNTIKEIAVAEKV